LPSGHEPAQAHNFPTGSAANADPVTGDHSLSRRLVYASTRRTVLNQQTEV
jgi:hypothetical protein